MNRKVTNTCHFVLWFDALASKLHMYLCMGDLKLRCTVKITGEAFFVCIMNPNTPASLEKRTNFNLVRFYLSFDIPCRIVFGIASFLVEFFVVHAIPSK
jgi:hypothetical protein